MLQDTSVFSSQISFAVPLDFSSVVLNRPDLSHLNFRVGMPATLENCLIRFTPFLRSEVSSSSGSTSNMRFRDRMPVISLKNENINRRSFRSRDRSRFHDDPETPPLVLVIFMHGIHSNRICLSSP